MLCAVLADFQSMSGVRTNTLLAGEVNSALADQVHRTGADEQARFCALAAAADYTLVIAPEFDDLLAKRCRWVEECGGRTLNKCDITSAKSASRAA